MPETMLPCPVLSPLRGSQIFHFVTHGSRRGLRVFRPSGASGRILTRIINLCGTAYFVIASIDHCCIPHSSPNTKALVFLRAGPPPKSER